jgi:hypothetical protein
MDELKSPNLEIDPRFCSGAWTGFYLQRWRPGRHTMTIDLNFRDRRLEADGVDDIGPFTFSGSYDLQNGKCNWTKQYLGKHQVSYAGINEGQGIWGVWQISALWGLISDRGVFHIWPEGTNPSSEAALTELADMERATGRPALAGVLGVGLVLFVIALKFFGFQWIFELFSR